MVNTAANGPHQLWQTGSTQKRAKSGQTNVLYRRRQRTLGQRLAPAIAALFVGTASTVGGVALARRSGKVAEPALPTSIRMTVRSGDTLWSLAKRFGDPDAYILDRVDALASANHLASDARLMPGQQIMIPVDGADDYARIRAAAATRP